MAYIRALFLFAALIMLVTGCSGTSRTQDRSVDSAASPGPTLPSIREAARPTQTPTASITPPKMTSPPVTATSEQPAAAPPTETPTDRAPTITLAPTETKLPAEPAPTTTTAPPEINQPTAIATSTATIEPAVSAATLQVPEDAAAVNGVPIQEIVIMPASVRENVRRIFAAGQEMGRNAHAFSKLGDSVTLTDHFLTRFDSGHYNLGAYANLQPAIDYYAGSFSRFGVATKIGLHAWSIFDPLWADKEWCLPDESMVACEFRLHNPSVLLIKIGSNDSGAASYFDQNLRQLLDFSISSGVIPILATKADRFEGPDDRNNHMIRQLAGEYAIPLWDYDRIAETLPRRGLSGDNVHMTMADADDYAKPETFERGYPVSDLTALMTLNEVMREVTNAGDS